MVRNNLHILSYLAQNMQWIYIYIYSVAMLELFMIRPQRTSMQSNKRCAKYQQQHNTSDNLTSTQTQQIYNGSYVGITSNFVPDYLNQKHFLNMATKSVNVSPSTSTETLSVQ